MTISRRNILISAIAMISCPYDVTAGDNEVLLRPPGAIYEDKFLSKCNRCYRCVQVCPTRVVFPASLKYGLKRANTPIVSFKASYCNSCLKCSKVCPTGALLPITKETLDIGVAKIIENCCVAWDWVGCTVCVDKCPLKAIYLDDHKRPVIDPEKCNGCGICQNECPSTSLRISIKGKGIVVVPRSSDMPRRKVELINVE